MSRNLPYLLAAACLTLAVDARALPDLSIAGVSLDPAAPQLGHIVDVEATITNIGDDSVPSFLCIGGDIPVHFLLDGELVSEQQLSCGLNAAEADAESAKIPIETMGTHTITVVVDPGGKIEEGSEDNNTFEITFETGQPELEIVPQLPGIGAPGAQGVEAGLSITNVTDAKIKDIYVWIEVEGKTGPIDIGWSQGTNLSAGEQHTWSGDVDFGLGIEGTPFPPGTYTWRYRVFKNGLPGSTGSVALTDMMTAPLELVSTVEVTEDNVIVPIVEPVASPKVVESLTAQKVLYEGSLYTVELTFSEPVDFITGTSVDVWLALGTAEVVDAAGSPVCDAKTRRGVLRGLLLWRDLIAHHPWYQGTYVALQEGYAWYKSEKHLKAVFYITQPFVIVKELLESMLAIGKDLGEWVKVKAGFGSEEEGLIGNLAFKASMVITKGLESAGTATQSLVNLSPLMQGQPYVSDTIVAERMLKAIEDGGEDFDQAIALVHEVIKVQSPDDYAKISQVLSVKLILGAIGSTLAEGVKEVLWTAVKKGFTAYFLSKLTAKTAWKIAVGEGSAVLMSGLTTAGIAKGVASFGLTLIIDLSIAYLTYVGTFVDNIRGPGGLIEAGEVVAQTIGWKHVLYDPDGGSEPLDVDTVEDTFLAHSVMFELYGFINSDLAMLKKLAFAKAQSKEYLADSLALFEVSKGQREFAVVLEQVVQMAPSPTCGVEANAAPEEPRHEPSPAPRAGTETPDDPNPPVEPAPPLTRWTKPAPTPHFEGRGSTAPVWWSGETRAPSPADPTLEGSGIETPEEEESGCSAAPRSSGNTGLVVLVLLSFAALLMRRRNPTLNRS